MRTSLVTASLAALMLAACARVPAPEASQTAAAGSLSCIPLSKVAGRRVANGSLILFEMAGPVDYLNPLQGQCPGLSRLGSTGTVSIASGGEGGRLCRGDRIRVVDPVESSGQRLNSIPTCVLADFTPAPRQPR